MKCERCDVESDYLKVGECPLCFRVTTVLSVIYCKWEPSEYKELAEALRGDTVENLIKRHDANKAFLSLRICRLMRHLGSTIRQGPDYLKTRVCAELIKQEGFEEKCTEYLRAHNMTREQGLVGISRQIAEMIVEANR